MSPPNRGPAADSPEVRARIDDALSLVKAVVAQIAQHVRSGIDPDDLASFAREGALVAARSFDPERGVPFRRWASIKMRGAAIDGARRQADLPRRVYARLRELETAGGAEEAMVEEDAASPPSTPEAADARLDQYLATMATCLASGTLLSRDPGALEQIEDDDASPEEHTARAELRAIVRDAIATRPEMERALIEKYWLEERTLDDVAAELGLSKSWASRIITRGLEGVTRILQNRIGR